MHSIGTAAPYGGTLGGAIAAIRILSDGMTFSEVFFWMGRET